MCISISDAIFLLSLQLATVDESNPEQPIHTQFYGNGVKGNNGANGMVLAVRAKNKLTPKSFRSLARYKSVLEHTWQQAYSSGSRSLSFDSSKASPTSAMATAFKLGFYQMVIGDSLTAIASEITKLPQQYQQTISNELISWGDDMVRAGYQFITGVFTGNAEKPEPICWSYEPLNPQIVEFASIHSHDGKKPGDTADWNHGFMIGFKHDVFDPMSGHVLVSHKNHPKALDAVLPNYVLARKYAGTHANGNVQVDIAAAKNGRMDLVPFLAV